MGDSSRMSVFMDTKEELKQQLLDMGYKESQVSDAVSCYGEECSIDVLVDFLYAKYGFSSFPEPRPIQNVEDTNKTIAMDPKDNIKRQMCDMGYEESQVCIAIEFCGEQSPVDVLADFIHAKYSCSILPDQCVGSGNNVEDSAGKCTLLDTKEALKQKMCDMGYEQGQVSHAIEFCGIESSVDILVDFIYARYGCNSLPDPSLESHNFGHGEHDADLHGPQMSQLESHIDEFTSSSGEEGSYHVVSSTLMHRLRAMGFSRESIQEACDTCGSDDFSMLLDYLMDAETFNSPGDGMDMSWIGDEECSSSIHIKKKSRKVRRKHRSNNVRDESSVLGEDMEELDEYCYTKTSTITSRKPFWIGSMQGFSLPGRLTIQERSLDSKMHGPPYFYFENIALMPSLEWETIKRFFNGVEPEFVDSAYFSACHRRRGYVHNLPLHGREVAQPKPPMTIQEAFPNKAQYFPVWDERTKVNCINTVRSRQTVCKEVAVIMSKYSNSPPLHEQKNILVQCKKFNLIWVGPGLVAPLDAREHEILLGFEEDHTRGTSSMTERYKALGNSFQVDTVAYHLSALKSLYPDGIKVLSLFTGIGGAEVALHKSGIRLKAVVSVESNKQRRAVLESWWKRTGQTGQLMHKEDVTELTHEVMALLVRQVGGFDLVIGGSPCNNLTGSNRVSRVGLGGEHSCLFFEFPRILDLVKDLQ